MVLKLFKKKPCFFPGALSVNNIGGGSCLANSLSSIMSLFQKDLVVDMFYKKNDKNLTGDKYLQIVQASMISDQR